MASCMLSQAWPLQGGLQRAGRPSFAMAAGLHLDWAAQGGHRGPPNSRSQLTVALQLHGLVGQPAGSPLEFQAIRQSNGHRQAFQECSGALAADALPPPSLPACQCCSQLDKAASAL